ncbi:MAG: protein-L-isoaspartate O-methyltransferase [Magnetococcales bacterium]|nr:protein-L-isoaspartate O-methyltransferase [Magnetococcales bacterium]
MRKQNPLILVAFLLLAPCSPLTVCFAQDIDATSDSVPIRASQAEFVDFMDGKYGHDRKMLVLRHQRFRTLVDNKDITRDKEKKAFLLTAREEFALDRNRNRAYDHAFLDIGYGVTISGPHLVMRMTSALDVQPSDKVLEIGTGSGYQSAVLAHLTNNVYSVEIIEPLHKRTKEVYQKLINNGGTEYSNVKLKSGDGYYGWEEFAPFNKIIVTCAVDHIPPPLLQQLAPNGIMVIPVGPPGKQTLLKVKKEVDEAGKTTISRQDVYNGRLSVSFVPFTKAKGGTWSGKGPH